VGEVLHLWVVLLLRQAVRQNRDEGVRQIRVARQTRDVRQERQGPPSRPLAYV